MKKRTARRLALLRYERRMVRWYPETYAPPCLLRFHNTWVRKHNRKQDRR